MKIKVKTLKPLKNLDAVIKYNCSIKGNYIMFMWKAIPTCKDSLFTTDMLYTLRVKKNSIRLCFVDQDNFDELRELLYDKLKYDTWYTIKL
jgi:hypothetical protein